MIEDTDFSNSMESLIGHDALPKKIAVAVSGGADSLCLCLLADSWCKKHNVQMFALTVDHGLRKESAQEAEFVHTLLTSKQIFHTTLLWKGAKPVTRIEEKAREERYRLLLSWCKEHDISVLLLAHHQDDQAETFLLRLIRSSGVDGLSAMQPRTIRDDINLWRPLLGFSRTQIHETMIERFHQNWIEDPSNQSMDYERVRLRQFQKELDGIGLSTQAVALSAKRLLRARQALEQITFEYWQKYVVCHEGGFVFIDKKNFNCFPKEIMLRIVSKALLYVSGSEARLSQLENLCEKISDKLCTTLSECVIISNKKGIYVCREYSKMPEKMQLEKGKTVEWSGFFVCCNQDVTVGPLDGCLKVKGVPAIVSKVIPAFFDKKGLAFVPSLDYKRNRTNITGTIKKKE